MLHIAKSNRCGEPAPLFLLPKIPTPMGSDYSIYLCGPDSWGLTEEKYSLSKDPNLKSYGDTRKATDFTLNPGDMR